MSQDFNLVFGGPLKEIRVARPCVAADGLRRMSGSTSLKLMSWNLLAPPYRRFRDGRRETEASWRARMEEQIGQAAAADADVIGLQEFWVENEAFVASWSEFASSRGYTMHVVPRTDGKRDGCAMLVRLPSSDCRFSAYTYKDWGSRILQVAELTFNGQPLTLMQTHLTFPHASAHDPPMRRQQGRKLAELTRARSEPLCVFGDLNGDVDDDAVRVLTTLGGLRAPPQPEPTAGEEAGDWVSHVAHTGDLMACDLVLTKGDCCVSAWRLADTRKELVDGNLTSDHRPVIATLRVASEDVLREDGGSSSGDATDEELSMH